MKLTAVLVIVASVAGAAAALWRRERKVPPLADKNAVPLWVEGAPGSAARMHEPERWGGWYVRNVHHPSLTPFLPTPDKANGTAVVVVPGGGLTTLVFPSEGVEPSEWLRGLGIAYGCAEVTRAIHEKLLAAGAPVEAHFLREGKHAFKLGRGSEVAAVREWPNLLTKWFGARGLLP